MTVYIVSKQQCDASEDWYGYTTNVAVFATRKAALAYVASRPKNPTRWRFRVERALKVRDV